MSLILVAALGAVLQGAPPAPAQQPVQVQAGVDLRPDTVTVGDPFTVTVRVRAPLGAEVEFPAGPDSTGTIQAVDPRRIVPSTDSLAVDTRAVYRMVAWDIEDQPVRFDDVVVRIDGVARRVPLGGLSVFVRSVLPADSAERVPKPQRDIFEYGRPWWHWLLAALAAAAVIWALWWWWRRHRRRGGPVVGEDPFDAAQREFERVERLGLVEAGERGRHVALMVEVLRGFLARRFPDATAALTTSEVLSAIRGESTVPATRLAGLLGDADLVKFARRAVSRERAEELGAEARAIVASVHESTRAAAAAASDEPERREAA